MTGRSGAQRGMERSRPAAYKADSVPPPLCRRPHPGVGWGGTRVSVGMGVVMGIRMEMGIGIGIGIVMSMNVGVDLGMDLGLGMGRA